MGDTKQSTDKPQKKVDRIMVISKDGSEITDEELQQVVGGMRASGRHSKTIDVGEGYTDVDDPF